MDFFHESESEVAQNKKVKTGTKWLEKKSPHGQMEVQSLHGGQRLTSVAAKPGQCLFWGVCFSNRVLRT